MNKRIARTIHLLFLTVLLAWLAATPVLASGKNVKINVKAKQSKTVTIDAGTSKKLAKKKTIHVTALWDGTKLNPKKVKWSSNKKSVAKVSKKGVITVVKGAKSGKTATITAKYKYHKKWYKAKIKVKVVKTKEASRTKDGWTTQDAIIMNRSSGLKFSWQDQIYVYLPGMKADAFLEFVGLPGYEPSHIEWLPSDMIIKAGWPKDWKQMAVLVHKGVVSSPRGVPCSALGRKDYYIQDTEHKMKWHIVYDLVSCVPAMDADIQALLRKYLGTDNLDAIRKTYTAPDAARKIINGAASDTNVRKAAYDFNHWRNIELFYWGDDRKGHIDWNYILDYAGIDNVPQTRDSSVNCANATYGTQYKWYEVAERSPLAT